MTQRNRPPTKKFSTPQPLAYLEPGMTVRHISDPAETGTVVESDEWWDTLLLRGIDISDQLLIEWTVAGLPMRRWERVNQLERVLSVPPAEIDGADGEGAPDETP